MSTRNKLSRRLPIVLFAIATALSGLMAAVPAVYAQTAPAQPQDVTRAVSAPPSVSLSSVVQKVVPSGKNAPKALYLSVQASYSQDTGPNAIVVVLLAGGPGTSVESHRWQFGVPKTDLKVSKTRKNETASLTVPATQLGAYGALTSLAFTSSTSTLQKAGCANGTSQTVYSGSLSGKIGFNTNANNDSAWGAISGQNTTVFGAQKTAQANSLVVGNCSPVFPPPAVGPCATGVQWSSPQQTPTQNPPTFEHILGSTLTTAGVTVSSLMATRVNRFGFIDKQKQISLFRTDSTVDARYKQTWSDLTKNPLTVTVPTKYNRRHSRLFTGSATVTASGPAAYIGNIGFCKSGGVKHDQGYTVYLATTQPHVATVRWQNGASPLVAKSGVGPAFQIGDPKNPSAPVDNALIAVWSVGPKA